MSFQARAPVRKKRARERQPIELDRDCAAARLCHPPSIEKQAVGHIHHRVSKGRYHLSGAELRYRAPVDIDERSRCASLGSKLCQSGGGVADCSDEPKRVSGLRAGAIGHVGARPADRGQSEHSRGSFGKRNRVAANEREIIALARMLDTGQEFVLPAPLAGKGQGEQCACRRCALRRKIRQVHRDELPADAGGRVSGKEMDALGHAVVGDDQSIKDGNIVEKAASFRSGSNTPQSADDFRFADHVDER